MKRIIKGIPNIVLVAMLGGIIAYGCANRGGGPQGGPRDTIPPRITKETPMNKQLQFNGNKFEIHFDEIVILDKVTENVIVSPPLKKMTMPKAYGKKVQMQFTDTLQPGRTYVVDFGNAIIDNNEGNPLKGYTYTFSTGPLMDTLQMSGYILNAATLDPCEGVIVGAHVEMDDSALTTMPFDIVSKTDANGHFCIKNAKEGTHYRIYALKDVNGNYMYDMNIEEIAFTDTTFFPIMWTEERNDTFHIKKGSQRLDSIHSYRIPVYRPNDILLKLFKEEKPIQKFLRGERKLPYKFSLCFGAPLDTLPNIQPLNFNMDSNYLVEFNTTKDTITYWLLDSADFSTDTLAFELYAPKTDSLGEIVIQMDTIRLTTKREIKNTSSSQTSSNKKNKKDKKDKKPKIEFLKLQTNIRGTFDVYAPIEIKFETPIKHYTDTMLHLSIKKDTLWDALPFTLEKDPTCKLFTITHEWKPEAEYMLEIDSAAFTEWYGKWTNKTSSRFKIRSLEEYSTLYVILPKHTGKEIIQIIDKKEKVIRESRATDEVTTFEYIDPGEYYLRLYIDENGNSKWDTGDYAKHRQPETVFYYPNKVTLRAYWDVEEEWDYAKVPTLRQKHADLKKKENTRRR